MRLARLDLTRYGKFTGGSLDFGEKQPGRPDLHIVYGPNEAGKSTAFSAFLDLLFGIDAKSRYGNSDTYNTMRIGAALELGGASPKIFGRVKKRQSTLLDASDQPLADSTLTGALGGLDRITYRDMFSLDDETIERGGEAIIASKGDLGQLLFSASAGLSELSSTLDGLRDEADRFHRGRSKSELAALKAELVQLKSDREALDTVLPAYRKLRETSEASRARYEREMSERNALQTRANAVERLLQALPRHARLLALRERLQPLSGLPHPPSGWRDELPALQREEIELSTRLSGCEAELAKLALERQGVEVDEPALCAAERIDELSAKPRARFLTAEDDLPERRRSLADHDAAISRVLRRLERDDEPDPDRLVLGASVLGALRDLVEQRSGVLATLETAGRQHVDAEQALAEAEAALEAAGVAASADAGIAALKGLVGAVRGNDHAARRRHAEKARVTLQDRLASGMEALRPWSGTVDQLAAGQAPWPADLARWKTAEAEVAQATARHGADAERLTAEQQRLKAEQEAAREVAGVVSDAEAAATRTQREQAWAAHRRDFRSETADAFETALRQDDFATAARLERNSELARLREVGRALALAEADLVHLAEQRTATAAAEAGLSAELGKVLQALGWPETARLPAAELERWLQRRVECLDLKSKLLDEDRAIENADVDAREARDRLAAALAAAGAAQREGATFAEVLAVAEAVIERDSNLSGLRTHRADCRSALSKRARALAEAKAAETEWTAAWTQACASCWLGENGAAPTLATVREVLTALAELGPWLEKRAALALRIGKMEDDQALFTRDVDRLGDELGLTDGPGPALERAAALAERLRAARGAEARRTELSARFAELEGQRSTIAEARTIQARRGAAMTALFGVASLADVGTHLDQAKERAELAAAAGEIEHDIVALLGAPSLAEAEASLVGADRAALEAERDNLKPRLADLDQRTHTLFAEHTRASDAVAAIGGDDAVARLAERRRTVLLDTEDRALGYLRLRIGIAAAEQALRLYRDKHRSSMMNRASDAFRIISRGAYTGLAAQPGDKGDVLVAEHANGSREASQLSKGTRFQLYLALRVAGYYEYCLSREPVPFVADDIMETFDDFRAEEAFRLFAGMAEVGQVVYLTHHRHLCDIARSVCPDVRVIELPAA